MRVHNPYENWFDCEPSVPFDEAVSVFNIHAPGYATLNNDVSYNYATSGADSSGALGVWSYTVIFALWPGAYQGILAAAGLSPSDVEPEQNQGTTDFNGCWTTPGSTWDGSSTEPDTTEKSNYEMTPVMKCHYLRTFVRGDHYTPPGDSSGYTGFAGQVNQTFEYQNGEPYGIGCYVRVTF